MKNFFGKIFGAQEGNQAGTTADLIADTLEQIIELSGFELAFDLHEDKQSGDILIDIYGADEEMLTAKEGQLLDAFQLYLKRVTQHQLPDEQVNITVDCDGFREEANQSLIDLADKLKSVAVDKGKPVYFRALPPRDRKVIHQYLASDGRVKSRSVGDGLYKKIKIFPVKKETSSKESQPSL